MNNEEEQKPSNRRYRSRTTTPTSSQIKMLPTKQEAGGAVRSGRADLNRARGDGESRIVRHQNCLRFIAEASASFRIHQSTASFSAPSGQDIPGHA
jgi:hypothetical protein